MPRRTTFASRTRLLAAVLLAVACSDSVNPGRPGPSAPQFDAAAAPRVALDQATGSVGASGTALWQGFSPTNPHTGDAIVATFFWRGSTNIITSVTDRLADGTPVGNSYTLVEYVQAGGISMATFVAPNVQNFPDPNADWNDLLEVQAQLSAPVTDGGVLLSAYTGVSAAALGEHRWAIGSGSSETTAGPGAISVNAGALVYGVTMSNDGVAGLAQPPGFATTIVVSDAAMGAEVNYAVPVSAGSVAPQWTWFFNAPSTPRTWLATVLALNPAASPQPAVATRLAFTVQPSRTTPGTTIAPAVKVAALDDAGNTVSSYTGSITVRRNPGPGTLSGTTTVAAVNGIASFSDLSIDQAANNYLLQAGAPGLRGATSTAFDIAAPAEVAAAAADGITLDQFTGTLGESGTQLLKGFDPTNPHPGDAIIATFFWLGSTNIITNVTDHLNNGTPVDNTYHLVEYVQAGGISMATYVATNVQNFPFPNPPLQQVLVVEATLAAPGTTAGGVLLSAWTGVDPDFTRAFTNVKSSASGSGTAPTIAHPGAIALNADALGYGVTMTNVAVGVIPPPPPDFTHLHSMSDGLTIATDAVYTVRTSAGSVDPQWIWFFDPQHPGTWLATGLALNPAPVAPPPATHLVFTVQPSNTTAGSTISPAVQVTAKDDLENTVTTFSGTITVALGANPGGGTLAGTKSVAAVNGVATFSTLSINNPGTGYTLVATTTAPGVTGTTSATFNIAALPQQARAQVSGGGRIDPSIGKTTFGFNVDGRSGPPFQGEMEVVYHGGTSRMTRLHSVVIDGLTSSPDPRGGVCITWSGSVRVNNADQRRFTATACDNGQPAPGPAKGPDRFGISVDGSVSTGLTDLTGGNSQARQ